MTLREWLTHAELRLRTAGFEAPRLEAQVLAGHILRVDRSFLFAHPEHEFPDLAGEAILQRREGHEPLAYIVGRREFFGRDFRVTPAVLIPRQDTEILVETALAAEAKTVLDVGTGSGAIAVTIKAERPHWNVTAVDVSPAALEVAKENAERLGADVRFLLSDAFEAVLGESFDLIVTNPPYIGRDEPLAEEVGRHEPELALYGGETGLEFYERLAREAAGYLEDGGRLMMEVGYRQAAAVRGRFEAEGWSQVETVADLNGIERVVVVSHPWACRR
ncbi:MAG: peptide chain release factor N(5)-glutamine methyltransferase [Fimbriimonas sp.]